MLRRLKHIDWSSESDSAWQELLTALQPGAAPLAELPKDQCNPFDPYTPALGSSFFGRGDELRRLQQAMEMGHSVSVVGDWRIGKTSLLAAFAEKARATGRVVRHLSGEGPEGASIGAFVTAVTGRPAPDEPDTAANQLSEWASGIGFQPVKEQLAIGRLAAYPTMGLRPVVILDEVERMITCFEHRFFERLRGMLERVMVVLCSRRELDLVYEERHLTSPFANTLELVRVALLSEPATEALLQMGNGLLTAEVCSTMREWCGRHAYFLQLYGHELADVRD